MIGIDHVDPWTLTVGAIHRALLGQAKRSSSRADPHRRPPPPSTNIATLAALLPAGRPPCFDTQAIWDEYIQHAAASTRRSHADGPVIWFRGDVTLNREFSYCKDCTHERKGRMVAAGRCAPRFLRGESAS